MRRSSRSDTMVARAPGSSLKFRTCLGPQYPAPMTPIPIIQLLLVMSRAMRSARTAPGENDQRSPQQDLQVQPQRPVFDIGQVKGDHLMEVEDRPTAHLPQ